MKLEWREHEGVMEGEVSEDIEANGFRDIYYSVWREYGKFIADADGLLLFHGTKERCMKEAQEHEDHISGFASGG